jgi:endoglucanase
MSSLKLHKTLVLTFIASFAITLLVLTLIAKPNQDSIKIIEGTSNTTPIAINQELNELENNIAAEYEELIPTDIEVPSETIENTSEVLSLSSVQVNKNNPFHDKALYLTDNSSALNQSRLWADSRPDDARKMALLSQYPTAKWLVDNSVQNTTHDLSNYLAKVRQTKKVPLFVFYNIPVRDCNSYSAGGATSAAKYDEWLNAVIAHIAETEAFVILEPDALPGLDCLSTDKQNERYAVLKSAINKLATKPNIHTYIDAGNSTWIGSTEMSARLRKIDIQNAEGFSLNVSGFNPLAKTIEYGEEISKLVGNKHFFIDTSRNGDDSVKSAEWCNPRNRAIGRFPSSQTDHPLLDAYLWIKVPGESDGTCNGGPNAGTWWPEYAIELVSNYERLNVPNKPSEVIEDWKIHSAIAAEPATVNKDMVISNMVESGKEFKNIVVDIEIYDQNNTKVAQNFFNNQNFNNGVVKEYLLKWKPTVAGKYTVKAGIFSEDWSNNYMWANSLLEFEVKAGSVLGENTLTDSKNSIDIWWPVDQFQASGVQPFKAVVNNLDLESYTIYWQVDGDRLNLMEDSLTDAPHKESLVDLSQWNWNNDKSYNLKFIAKDLMGNVFAEKSITLLKL